jgi:hypothetical protein
MAKFECSHSKAWVSGVVYVGAWPKAPVRISCQLTLNFAAFLTVS